MTASQSDMGSGEARKEAQDSRDPQVFRNPQDPQDPQDRKGLCILGSTGSIGLSTLDVARRNQDRFKVVALTANQNHERLAAQIREWEPAYAVIGEGEPYRALRQTLQGAGIATELLAGPQGLEQVARAPESDYVMAAIVGGAGLLPTLAAARAGKRVLLANKEALVMSGGLFMSAVREHGAELLPIDSEHNAIFQCLPVDFGDGFDTVGVKRILLTASGGPFRTVPPERLRNVTPDEACAHPNWAMGRKISVDSATMMNKGLEVIEARWLFATEPNRIKVVVHPQSVIHSMVEYADGSVLAQLGNPDMRTPIAHALSWPERMGSGVDSLDLLAVGRLDFEDADFGRFPCLRLGFEAAHAGGAASAILNGANEIAVAAFLEQRIRFTEIPSVLDSVLSVYSPGAPSTIEDVLAVDAEARRLALERVAGLAA